ncbi:glycosyltransferase involved in cell wall biosynthesis [Natranaerovirga hydrolytica]|uniref:Glycosyltransferase involved in cell wall biosynthesis n=1 Tax=Natranaerovirga hydrolytica TaxID=680378 RepID=A0A4R1MZB2_9FIRM|nr:glycosyltransferase family 2 protein [Natranaerovirga hydrolytica]TCK98515.1 glycosyltransferase involved in cell wall biosynthesis [Natranaerovirga hydrolytica]
MITISLCMIVKNEEALLARCLDTIKDIVDEINIVDTGSTDRTVEIAKQYTDRVFFFEWIGNFAAARNESFKYATKEYILYLDADDVVLEEDRAKLKELKETLDPSVDSVSMYYDAGTDEFGNVTLRYRRNRLVKREKNFLWCGDCHQYLAVNGKIINADIAITHKKIKHAVGRTVSIYEKKIERGDDFSPRDYFYYGNELRENGHYEKAIESYDKNIALKEGWIEDKIFACIFKADCYRFLGDLNNELNSLFQSFQLSAPRAEACSRIGYNFQQKTDYKTAAFWYELAIQQVPDPDRWSFVYTAYHTWYPHLQLCVCYYNLGDYQKAYEHNEEAMQYRPEDQRMRHNKALLKEKLNKPATVKEDN